MLRLMNSAAVRTRDMPAPMLYDCAPQSGGATAVPSPDTPWHFAHVAGNTRAPAAVSALNAAHFCKREFATKGDTTMALDRDARYGTMSCVTPPPGSRGVLFILRRNQSSSRYSIVSTTPLRARYWGYRANAPSPDPAVSRRPASR